MKNNYKRTIFSWSMYDFANQPFTTLTVTFIFSTYFANAIAPNVIDGSLMWSWGISITAIFIALFSPLMGAIADQGGYRKVFLFIWTVICIVGSFFLFYVYEGQIYKALIWFIIANIGFEMGSVFCNAYLPHIAPREKVGRISGYGWSLGYVGGLIALVLCLYLFIWPSKPIFNLHTHSPINSLVFNIDDITNTQTSTTFYVNGDLNELLNIEHPEEDSSSIKNIEGMYVNSIDFSLTKISSTSPTIIYQNETELISVKSVSMENNSFTVNGFTESFNKHKDLEIKLIGKPSWVGSDHASIKAETGYLFDSKYNFEIMGPVYSSLDDGHNLQGVLCYHKDGNLKLSNDDHIIKQSIKTSGENIRAINIFIAIWFMIFCIPTFLWVRDKKVNNKFSFTLIKKSYSQIKNTFKDIKKYKNLTRFLIARIFYNDGLITIFAFGGIYAQGAVGFSFQDVMIFGIVLNVAAGLGAFLSGFLDDRIGGKNTVQLSNLGLIIACLIAVFGGYYSFWVAGVIIGLCSGPNQAASRSLMSRFTPLDKQNEFFGFFAFSGKATAFIGPILVGIVTVKTGSLQSALIVIAVLVLLGAFLLYRVNEDQESISSSS